METALPPIMAVLNHLARRAPRRLRTSRAGRGRSAGASAASGAGKPLRAAAQAASTRKGTVGITGSTRPLPAPGRLAARPAAANAPARKHAVDGEDRDGLTSNDISSAQPSRYADCMTVVKSWGSAAAGGAAGARLRQPELHALMADMQDTMKAANGAGLAAPQIGVDLQVVIFGSDEINPRYPTRRRCPAPCSSTRSSRRWATKKRRLEGCLSVPGCAAWSRAGSASATPATTRGQPHRPRGRLPRPRGAARVRPPSWASSTRCGARFQPLRLHRRPVPASTAEDD